MVIVSHDRMFLDKLCTKIVETERGVAGTFLGNYTQYTVQKAERIAQQWAAFEKQQKELAKQKEIVARLSGGGQSGRASAAEKTIDRMKAEGIIEKPFEPKRRQFRFPAPEDVVCGKTVLELKNLTHGYGSRTLFREADLTVQRGERVAIMGPNGAGKSTLLRLLRREERPVSGDARLGEHNIIPNYFEQNQAEALDLGLTVLETIQRAAPDAQLNDIKALLGQMMFSGKMMDKPVSVLSGGEKARLALAKFMLTPATLLILDEPTNHLDIPSKEMLEEALCHFDGAVVVVSHDRYFLRKVATRIVTVRPGGVLCFFFFFFPFLSSRYQSYALLSPPVSNSFSFFSFPLVISISLTPHEHTICLTTKQQIEEGQLVDYDGDYETYIEKNEAAAEIQSSLDTEQRELEKSMIKAKSKMSKAQKAQIKKDKAREFNGNK
jgi:ATPase subunit of ABC transporter with duplicated ATPase domains